MRLVSRFTLIFLVCMGLAFGTAPSAKANGSNWWHSSTQPQRDQYILNQGASAVGSYGGQCKAWVQNVVYAASGNHVWLPLNQASPNNYMWAYDPNNHASGACMYIEYAPVGWIVQMRLSDGTAHTAIVAGKSSTTITFLDSNWQHDETVRYHTLTYTQFYNMLASTWSFTVYHVQ